MKLSAALFEDTGEEADRVAAAYKVAALLRHNVEGSDTGRSADFCKYRDCGD